jgi:hypothetical protein
MKMLQTMVLTGTLAGSTLMPAGNAVAQVRTLTGETKTVTVTIEAIEQSSRTITVKDDKGIHETIVAPPEMLRFSELKVGDKVTARYYENVVIRMKKPDEPAIDVLSAAATRGDGASPAATAAAQRTITVTVTAMDAKTMSATVRGPNGYVYSRRLADKKSFDQLKVGDRLDMTWTDAVLLSVDAAPK